jgi:hypothetical protein
MGGPLNSSTARSNFDRRVECARRRASRSPRRLVGAGLAGLTAALHWAGTETATYRHGSMDGAITSGRRAAAEVLDA